MSLMNSCVNRGVVVFATALALTFQSSPGQENKPEWKQETERRSRIITGAESEIVFYGKVVDTQGRPVAGATVSIAVEQWSQAAPRIAHVESAVDGTFQVSRETYGLPQLRGSFLSVKTIEKSGYEWDASRGGERLSFSYRRRPLHTADCNKPVVFHLRKVGMTTHLLDSPDLITAVAVRPDGASVMAEFSKDSNYYWPDRKCPEFPGFAVSASLAKDTKDWVLTFKGKDKDDEVLLLDAIVYEGSRTRVHAFR